MYRKLNGTSLFPISGYGILRIYTNLRAQDRVATLVITPDGYIVAYPHKAISEINQRRKYEGENL